MTLYCEDLTETPIVCGFGIGGFRCTLDPLQLRVRSRSRFEGAVSRRRAVRGADWAAFLHHIEYCWLQTWSRDTTWLVVITEGVIMNGATFRGVRE